MHVTQNENEHSGDQEIHFDCIIPPDVYPICKIRWYYDELLMGPAIVKHDTLIFNKSDFCPAGFPGLVRCLAINSIMTIPVALDAHNEGMNGLILFENLHISISVVMTVGGFVITIIACLCLVYALWFKGKDDHA